jgi:hypothetical protein
MKTTSTTIYIVKYRAQASAIKGLLTPEINHVAEAKI